MLVSIQEMEQFIRNASCGIITTHILWMRMRILTDIAIIDCGQSAFHSLKGVCVKICVSVTNLQNLVVDRIFDGYASAIQMITWARLFGPGEVTMMTLEKLTCKEIRLNKTGYDSSGTYYGVFRRLYSISGDKNGWIENVRADTRQQAQECFENKPISFKYNYYWAWKVK